MYRATQLKEISINYNKIIYSLLKNAFTCINFSDGTYKQYQKNVKGF